MHWSPKGRFGAFVFFFAINQNWVMKTARGPRVNELDELDEDTRFFFFFFFLRKEKDEKYEIKFKMMCTVRAIHGSVRVEFVPNS